MTLRQLHLPFNACILLLACSISNAADHATEDYSRLIIGKWLGPRKFEVYYSNGTWGVQRNENAPIDIDGRTWKIKDSKLIISFPGVHGIETGTQTIGVLNKTQFITKDDGHSFVRDRVVDDAK